MIVKKDGRREVFSKEKVRNGLLRACEKRDISIHTIDAFIDELERDLRDMGKRRFLLLSCEKIMKKLHALDDIAYVRFASVYREFKDVNDFVDELKAMLTENRG